MISTRGSSSAGRCSAAAERARAERRPNGERGRLGMTERVLGRRHRREIVCCPPHSSTHPEGWRDWPYETPPTIPRKRETVAIPSGSKTTAWEMRRRGVSRSLRRTQAEVQSIAGRCPEVQGVLDHLSARGPLCLRALLRTARGRLREAGGRAG